MERTLKNYLLLTCKKLDRKSAVQYVPKVTPIALARLGADVAKDMLVINRSVAVSIWIFE